MVINVALGRTRGTGNREQGTRNRASGRRRGQMSEVGGPKFRGTKYEVRGASGTLALTRAVSGDPPNRNREQGTGQAAEGEVRCRRAEVSRYEVRGTRGEVGLRARASARC